MGGQDGKIQGLLTKCEVKMAGYWPRFASLWNEAGSRLLSLLHKLEKKQEVNVQPHYMASCTSGKINQILRCDWPPERARWSYLARSGLPAASCKKIPRKPYLKSFLDQVCSVKMAAWILSSFFFFCEFTPSRSINTQKKPTWPHTWSITDTSWPNKPGV